MSIEEEKACQAGPKSGYPATQQDQGGKQVESVPQEIGETNPEFLWPKPVHKELHQPGIEQVQVGRVPTMRLKEALPQRGINKIEVGTALVMRHGKQARS